MDEVDGNSIPTAPRDFVNETENRLKDYEFRFENLAFKGGGVKVVAYIGALETLDKFGILENIKRYSGTSGGAIIAACLAVGIPLNDLKELACKDLYTMVCDAKFGRLAIPWNVWNGYGWNPGHRILQEIRTAIGKATGNEHITFKQVFDNYGKELCIVATNLNTMAEEYFHPKTTPDVEVAIAVRSSIALPGYLQPEIIKDKKGNKRYFLDGGLVCNFPVHAFDGWFLSMKEQDSFFSKIGSNDKPFSTLNPKTLGIMTLSNGEGEFMEERFHLQLPNLKIERPDTELANKRGDHCDWVLSRAKKKAKLVQAGKKFMDILSNVHNDSKVAVEVAEFKKAFDKFKKDKEATELLFGKNFNWADAFDHIAKSNIEKISTNDFLVHMESLGINLWASLSGGNIETQINSFEEFFHVTIGTILNSTRRVYFQDDDIQRTLCIYSDYVHTADFGLTTNDKEFLMKQGKYGTLAYLDDLVLKHSRGDLQAEYDDVVIYKSQVKTDLLKAVEYGTPTDKIAVTVNKPIHPDLSMKRQYDMFTFY